MQERVSSVKSFNTDKEIQSLKAKSSQYYASDRLVKNLYLVVRGAKREKDGASKTFFFRYMFEGKNYQLSLGKYPNFSLSSARAKANQFNEMLDNPQNRRDGKHPKAIIEQAKQRQKTFFEVTEEWKRSQNQNDTTKLNRVKNHLNPFIGNKPIGEITKQDLLDCIQRLQDDNKLEASRRVFLIAREIMRFAVMKDYIENSLLGDIDFNRVFKVSEPEHYRAITDEGRFRDLLLAIEDYKGSPITKLALKISPYLFLRANNMRGLKWEYIHFNKKQIIIPAREMKMKQEFIVPLCESVINILKEVKQYSHASSYVFPSDISKSKQMSENTLNQAIKRLGFGDEMVFHSFRATASTILHDKIKEHGHDSDVIELCLDHKERNKVKASYNHSKRLEDRESLMQWWGQYIDMLKSSEGDEYISKIKG